MHLADELLQDLQTALGARTVPRVRALHLPPQATRGSKDGEFGALELDDGALGLSYVLLGDALGTLGARQATGAPGATGAPDARGGPGVPGSASDPLASQLHRALQAPDAPGTSAAPPAPGDPQASARPDRPDGAGLAGADPLALARQWRSGDPARQALGFAAVNALSRHVFDRAGFVPPPAGDSLAGLDPRPGEHVGMVGLFPPLVPQVLAAGARLTVLELRPELAGARDGYTVTLDPAALAGCDKLLATSTIVLNGSVDRILAAARGARLIALVGPGAACLPDALFRRGVHTLAGTWVTDAAGFKAALARGASWSACARKFTLTRAAYPGLAALQAVAPA